MQRHTLSVLVEDKPGVLARVSGLLSRRGFNIESLAVGPTEHDDISRMTIVVAVEDLPLEQVTKQLNKLIHVLKIVELEPGQSVQRQVILVKVRADSAVRSQVLEIVELFRAKAVDVTPESLTIEATGTAEKIAALLKNLEPYGIREMVQSGTIAVGRGYRTNDEGIRQLRQLTAELIDELIVVALPHWQGPNDVLHLMSLISPVDYNLALVYSKLLPVPFREWLLAWGIKLLEIPDAEYDSMGCNVLAVAPRKCIMLAGNPRTKAMLVNEGVEVWEYEGEEISRKGAGGPTCLTRPILRK